MSLRLRLAVLSSLMTLLALALLGFSSGVSLWRGLLQGLDDELQVQSKVVLDSLRADSSINQTATDALTTKRGSSTAWVYKNGALVEGAGVVDAPEPLDSRFFNSNKISGMSNQASWRVSSVRFGTLVVQVGRPLENLEETLEKYIQNTALYGFLAAIGTGLITTVLVARSTKPLANLATRAAHPDDLLPMPHTALTDEIGALARALEQGRVVRANLRTQETRFLADAAHELRTPVTAILAALEVRLFGTNDPKLDRLALEKAAKQAKHLRDLAQNLLALTRAERSLSVQPVDLLELAGNAVDLLAPLAAQKNLDISCDGVAAPIQGDAILLARAIENLIANSIKFTDSGEIAVTVGQTWLEVRDTGVGIAPKNQAQILEPFHRHGNRDGSGLGLAVVQAVVSAHKGTIELSSSVGIGTRVKLVFA